MTIADLIEVLKQSPDQQAPATLRVRDAHDWIIRCDIGDVTFDEHEHVVVIDGDLGPG